MVPDFSVFAEAIAVFIVVAFVSGGLVAAMTVKFGIVAGGLTLVGLVGVGYLLYRLGSYSNYKK